MNHHHHPSTPGRDGDLAVFCCFDTR